jgi:predicted RecB family nuclease
MAVVGLGPEGTMQLTASDIVSLYRPTPCSLRLYLREQGVAESEPSAFDQIIQTLGTVHEQKHLATLGLYEDISKVERERRVSRTLEAIRNRVPVIFQAEFEYATTISGSPVIVVGRPDFLILDGNDYIIRDSKLSRKVDEDHHEEIALQLQLYGWLFERTVRASAKSLEVHTGSGDLVDVPYDGGTAALAKLAEVLAVKQMTTEPYEPVGWSKCKAGCGYAGRCWPQAEARQDVSLVMDIDQGLARQLHAVGIATPQQLVSSFDVQRLSDLKRPWGARQQKVGKNAESILRNAEVLISGTERILAPAIIPTHFNYVMFDLEGMPPTQDDLEKVYLWGMQVYGDNPSKFFGATAGFGVDGDREGWNAFLDDANAIFTEYGDIPFVHWHHYERVHIEMYVKRYGDSAGVAARVATTLAAVMREGILEIAKLRLTKVGADDKARELFAYVVGNEFQTRFRDMADAVAGLQNIQRAERTWHENQWSKQSRLHAQIESRHREVNATLQLIAKAGGSARKKMAIAVGQR